MRSFVWRFAAALLAVTCRSAIVPPATGDMCFADDVRSTILNDVLYFMGGSYSFVGGDTNSNEQYLYYLNLSTSFPVEGYIPVNSLHSVAVPSSIGTANTGAFFTAGDMLYSYSTDSNFPYSTNTIIGYNTVTNTWSNLTVSGGAFNIAGRGAAFSATNEETGMGFYLGTGSPGDSGSWDIQGLLVFDGSDANNLKWTNQTTDAPIIDTGTMVYIPLSKEGVLIAFAGADTTETSSAFSDNCCYGTVSMATINVYDIASSTWYSVTATGSIPPQRMQPCSVVSASPDGSSFQITMYQGWNLLEGEAFEDVYVLTIPSFRWIKISDTGNTEQSLGSVTGRFGGACSVWNDRQMIVVGGGFRIGSTQVNGGTSCNTSYPAIRVLDTNTYAWQTQFQSDLNAYEVPEAVYNVIGGNGSGGATATAPSGGFSNTNLETIFALTITTSASTSSTRGSTLTATDASATTKSTSSASSSASSTSKSKSTPTGAIAGGVVGGIAVIAAALGGIWYFMRHRRREDSDFLVAPTQNPKKEGVELDANGEPKNRIGEIGVGQAFGRSELPNEQPVYELPYDGRTVYR